MEAHYIGFNMWVKGVEKAGTTDPDAVIDALIGVSVPNLSGGYSALMPNHHITKPVLIGEIQAERAVQHRFRDPGPGRGPGMVALRRRHQGPDRRLAGATEMRCVQREDRHVHRWQEGLIA